jgi:lysine 2,3-aminomutase
LFLGEFLEAEVISFSPGILSSSSMVLTCTATSICPVYCRFCTRSYAVGANTETVSKSPQKPSRRRWEIVFQHIENDPSLHDIVVSGGDAYYLQPDDLREIGERFVNNS